MAGEYTEGEDFDVVEVDAGSSATPMGEIALPDISGISEAEGDLTVDEAEYLTEMIRATADMMWVLLSRAHAGKAWKALGYDSFGAYVNAEFNISRSRAYQLLQQARVIEALEAAAPEGTNVQITEAAARDLKNLVDDLVPEIAARTEGMTPDEAAAEIAAVVEEARAGLDDGAPVDMPGGGFSGDYMDDFVPPDLDDAPWREPTSGPVPGPKPTADDLGDQIWPDGDGSTPAPVPAVSSDDDEWDEEWDDDEDMPTPGNGGHAPATPSVNPSVFDEYDDDEEDINPALLRRRVQSAYDLYSTLMTMSDMPAPEDVIAIIPAERRLLIDQSIDKVIDWLSEFRTQWNDQPWKKPDSE